MTPQELKQDLTILLFQQGKLSLIRIYPAATAGSPVAPVLPQGDAARNWVEEHHLVTLSPCLLVFLSRLSAWVCVQKTNYTRF
jgi:hypothetical protein